MIKPPWSLEIIINILQKKKKKKKNKGHKDLIFITGALEEKKILPKTTEQITYKIHNMKQSLNLF